MQWKYQVQDIRREDRRSMLGETELEIVVVEMILGAVDWEEGPEPNTEVTGRVEHNTITACVDYYLGRRLMEVNSAQARMIAGNLEFDARRPETHTLTELLSIIADIQQEYANLFKEPVGLPPH